MPSINIHENKGKIQGSGYLWRRECNNIGGFNHVFFFKYKFEAKVKL